MLKLNDATDSTLGNRLNMCCLFTEQMTLMSGFILVNQTHCRKSVVQFPNKGL